MQLGFEVSERARQRAAYLNKNSTTGPLQTAWRKLRYEVDLRIKTSVWVRNISPKIILTFR